MALIRLDGYCFCASLRTGRDVTRMVFPGLRLGESPAGIGIGVSHLAILNLTLLRGAPINQPNCSIDGIGVGGGASLRFA